MKSRKQPLNRISVLVALGLILLGIAPAMATPSITGDSPVDGFTTYFDDFSGRANAFDFDGVLGDYTTSGSSATTLMSSGRWSIEQTGTGSYEAGWDGSTSSTPWAICDTGATLNPYTGFSMDIVMPEAPGTNFAIDVRVAYATVSSTDHIGFRVSGTTTWTITAILAATGGGSTSTTLVSGIPPGEPFNVEVGNIDCAEASATFIASNATMSEARSLDAGGTFDGSKPLDFFQTFTNPTSGDRKLFVDNVTLVAPVTVIEANGACPNPAKPLFGYNFAEDVTFQDFFFSSGTDPGELNGFYEFVGDNSDNAYLAKGWPTTPSRDMYTRATLESQAEGTSSTFRFSFSHVDPTPFISADNFTTAAKGDGSTTGVFANTTEVVFTETGNDWEIHIEEVFSGSRVQTGQAFLGLNPNTPTDLEIGINTNNGEELVYVENEFGTRILEVIPNQATDKDIYSIWLVGAGSNLGVSRTALDDNSDAWASSCWFWNDIEPTLLGDQGSLPFEEGVTEGPGGPGAGGGVGSGIFGSTDSAAAVAFFGSETGANFFFGFLFIVGLAVPAAATAAKQGYSPVMAGGAAGALGLVLGWAFGFISDSFMFVVVVLILGIVGAMIWRGRGGA